MQFDEIKLLQRIIDPGDPICHITSGPAGPKRVHAWIACAVIPQVFVIGARFVVPALFLCRILRHKFIVAHVGSIGHAHRISATPDPRHLYQWAVDESPGLFQLDQPLFGSEDSNRSAI
jgi:hypothetical protein